MKRIGLCWAGSRGHKNDHNRSIPWPIVEQFATVPDVQWYSLVIGERESDAEGAAWLTQAGDQYPTFMASARFIAGLDLVITCDTAVAHLSGALNVPTWVMIPVSPDFRWQLYRNDSPWYPSLKLYRQDRAKDWQPVVQRVIHDLPLHLTVYEVAQSAGVSTAEVMQAALTLGITLHRECNRTYFTREDAARIVAHFSPSEAV